MINLCYNSSGYERMGDKYMKEVTIHSEYITLGQLLKLADAVSSGAEAKLVISDGLVFVNGEVETRRGKKLYHQDIVSFNGEEYQINNENQ